MVELCFDRLYRYAGLNKLQYGSRVMNERNFS